MTIRNNGGSELVKIIFDFLHSNMHKKHAHKRKYGYPK